MPAVQKSLAQPLQYQLRADDAAAGYRLRVLEVSKQASSLLTMMAAVINEDKEKQRFESIRVPDDITHPAGEGKGRPAQ